MYTVEHCISGDTLEWHVMLDNDTFICACFDEFTAAYIAKALNDTVISNNIPKPT